MAVLALIAGAVTVLIPTRFTDNGVWDRHLNRSSRTFDEVFWVTNDGILSEHVTGVTVQVPGLRVLRVSRRNFQIGPGEPVKVVLHIRVTNCAIDPSGEPPLVLAVDKWWGTRTVTTTDSGGDPDSPARAVC